MNAALAETGATSLPADALTALISGALDEAVLWLMQNDDVKSRQRLETALATVLRRAFGR